MNPTTSFLGAPARVVYLVIKSVLFSALVSSLTTDFACAGSATWNATPSSQYWSYPANWTPATVPSTTADTATFGVSSITSLEQVFLSVGSIIFNPGASAYTLNPYNPDVVTMAGPGIINNSGVVQTINVPAVPQFAGDEESYNELSFASSATAGTLIQYTVYGSSCADGKTNYEGGDGNDLTLTVVP